MFARTSRLEGEGENVSGPGRRPKAPYRAGDPSWSARFGRAVRSPLATLRRLGYRFGIGSEWASRTELRQARRILARSRGVLHRLSAPSAATRKVLFLSTRGGWTTHVAYCSVIGWALRLRGAECHFWECSGGLPVCDFGTFRDGPPMPCHNCEPYGRATYDSFRHPWSELADYVGKEEAAAIAGAVRGDSVSELARVEHLGLPIGRMAQISTRWHLNRGSLTDEPGVVETYRRFVAGGCVLATACKRLLDARRPDVVVLLNGLFMAEQIFAAQARSCGARVVTYERGFLADTVRFACEGEVASRFEIEDLWPEVADIPLTREQDAALDSYLQDRRRGKRAIVHYWPELEEDPAAIARELGLDPDRPIASIFTNILWDSSIQERDRGFHGMFDWLEQMVRRLGGSRMIQLVVRVHPAEVRLAGQETTESVHERLEEIVPELPPTVRIVPAESPLSSYSLMEMSDAVLVYTSTVGLEAALLGRPVLVAGQTHYRGKGFTVDLDGPDDIEALGDRLERRSLEVPAEQIELARRYAHALFFRSIIPFRLVEEPVRAWPLYGFRTLADLVPGRDRTLDVICETILEGTAPYL